MNGFGGVRIKSNILTLNPALPDAWSELQFRLVYRGVGVNVTITHETIELSCEDRPMEPIPIGVIDEKLEITANQTKYVINRYREEIRK